MSTKLTFAWVGMVLGLVVSLTGLALAVAANPNGLAVLGQGLGLVTLVFGAYSTANVAQKKVIGQNYRPELDKETRCGVQGSSG